MSDWEFGTEKEMHDAVHGTRKQKLTASRLGEYFGGFLGLLIVVGLCLWHFFEIDWPHPSPVRLVVGYCGSCVAGLFIGALVGKKLVSGDKNRVDRKSR